MRERLQDIINSGLKSLKERNLTDEQAIEDVLRQALLHLFFNNESPPSTITIHDSCSSSDNPVRSYTVNNIMVKDEEVETRRVFATYNELVQFHNPNEWYQDMVPVIKTILESGANCQAIFSIFYDREDQTLIL